MKLRLEKLQVLQKRGHLEHLSRSFAVTGGNNGSVDVKESMTLEELVGSKGQCVAYA